MSRGDRSPFRLNVKDLKVLKMLKKRERESERERERARESERLASREQMQYFWAKYK